MKKILKQPVWLLTICMAVVIVFSLLANVVNTSGWQVKVEKVNFDTKSDAITGTFVGNYEGNMEGLLVLSESAIDCKPCSFGRYQIVCKSALKSFSNPQISS